MARAQTLDSVKTRLRRIATMASENPETVFTILVGSYNQPVTNVGSILSEDFTIVAFRLILKVGLIVLMESRLPVCAHDNLRTKGIKVSIGVGGEWSSPRFPGLTDFVVVDAPIQGTFHYSMTVPYHTLHMSFLSVNPVTVVSVDLKTVNSLSREFSYNLEDISIFLHQYRLVRLGILITVSVKMISGFPLKIVAWYKVRLPYSCHSILSSVMIAR